LIKQPVSSVRFLIVLPCCPRTAPALLFDKASLKFNILKKRRRKELVLKKRKDKLKIINRKTLLTRDTYKVKKQKEERREE
jgi:hypothetical protein